MVVSWTPPLVLFLLLLLLLLPLHPPLLRISTSHSSVRVLGVAVLSRWPVPTLAPS